MIETTAEHPFFVEHKGFTPAGLLAIGNSIVTRAGPPLALTGIQKKAEPATVYNFTVEEFHTYFVGTSALWVHNITCQTSPELVAELAANGINHNPGAIVRIARDSSGKIVFLESQKIDSGWLHIIERKAQFEQNGIVGEDAIADAVMAAVTNGRQVGVLRTSNVTPRPVYEVLIAGHIHHIGVTVSSNGYIVGAQIASKWVPL